MHSVFEQLRTYFGGIAGLWRSASDAWWNYQIAQTLPFEKHSQESAALEMRFFRRRPFSQDSSQVSTLHEV